MKNWKNYEFHPLADEYPLMPAHDLGRMEEGMRRLGFDPKFPIILFQGKILDGRNRYLSAKAAEVKPVFEEFDGTEEEARLFVQIANEERRHLSAEWLQKRRQERIERVAAARQEGLSTRAIAEAEGVSQGQIRRDLKEAGESGDSPDAKNIGDNGKITGKDGKEYPVARPPETPKIQCERCKRLKLTNPNCPACKEAAKRKPKPSDNGKGDSWEGDAKEPKVAPMDQLGNPVPKSLRDTFAGNTQALENGVKMLQEVRRTVKGLEKWNAYMRPTDMETKLDELIEDFKNGLPYAVCQECKGKGCAKCRQEGWFPKWFHAEMAR